MKMFKRGLAAASVAIIGLIASAHALPDTMPGNGKAVRYVQADNLGANYVSDQIVTRAMKALGYDVRVSTMNITLFFPAVAQGDVDISTGINLPQREPQFKVVEQQAEVIGTGIIAGGGVNGYLIDKKTALAHNITRLDQLKDPKIASLFGTDGKADLISCGPGWSCSDVVNYQLKKFGLTRTVRVVNGKYEALMSDAISRIRSGAPVFFYAWSPSWVTAGLVPGRDVVWLPASEDALPPGMPNTGSALVKGVVGCAGNADPCRMAMASWNGGTVANKGFIRDNPSIRALIQQVKFSQAAWSGWELAISKAPGSSGLFSRLADQWIADNQAQFDQWIATARTAR
ncbi:glycine betaine transporter periplasmic subunit [Caballeronia arvi]|uniref:Glycine betaine transporter periplasmic subunit n=1 Tax=Caballeronia arvi TaxID=1777135 RepID=A0A158KQY4_9BURK|nr:glycine betaine/L-proline ABC transporter substrate-binding protein ProX [Caballeronia arvi]SAL83566.1 glycine betaine transporter periplasmic subunit [Caballeronia arvi]